MRRDPVRYLLNSEFLVSLYSNLPSLLKCLLLDEGHLDTRLLETVIGIPFWDMMRTNHLVHLTEYFIVVQRAGCHGCWMGEKTVYLRRPKADWSEVVEGQDYLDLTILVNIRR